VKRNLNVVSTQQVGLEPGRFNIENLNEDSQCRNYLSYCCLYDTDVLLHIVELSCDSTGVCKIFCVIRAEISV